MLQTVRFPSGTPTGNYAHWRGWASCRFRGQNEFIAGEYWVAARAVPDFTAGQVKAPALAGCRVCSASTTAEANVRRYRRSWRRAVNIALPAVARGSGRGPGGCAAGIR
jgi:hypothetical protein